MLFALRIDHRFAISSDHQHHADDLPLLFRRRLNRAGARRGL